MEATGGERWPGSKGQARALYIARINRVIDYIDTHVDEDLTLERLSEVAHFSPYHFHRVFHGLIGETLGQFIQRLRLERAAAQLINMPGKSITEVGLSSGFASPATFARAFKQAYRMSASEWRMRYSNPGKMDSKPGKESGPVNAYDKAVTAAGAAPVSLIRDTGGNLNMVKPISVKVQDIPAFTVAYVRHIGPYKGNGKLFEELWGKIFRWAGPRGLVGPDTQMIIMYHDNPEITDESKLRTSVCLSVPAHTAVDGEIGKMDMPGGQYAFLDFELAPDEYQGAWNYVFAAWLPDSGYEPDDRPPYEKYGSGQDHNGPKHVVTICIPVKPL